VYGLGLIGCKKLLGVIRVQLAILRAANSGDIFRSNLVGTHILILLAPRMESEGCGAASNYSCDAIVQSLRGFRSVCGHPKALGDDLCDIADGLGALLTISADNDGSDVLFSRQFLKIGNRKWGSGAIGYSYVWLFLRLKLSDQLERRGRGFASLCWHS
jgi:hypothetical protein